MSKRIAYTITIICVIILLALGILDWAVFSDEDVVQDYVRGTFTETLGILITVLIIERLIDSHDKRVQVRREAKSILNAHRVTKKYVSRFNIYAYQVVTPLSQRGNLDPSTRCPLDWKFSDMSDLFDRSLLPFDDDTPVVLQCLSSLVDLQVQCKSVLARIDFEHFPQLCETLLKIVEQAINASNLYDGIKYELIQFPGKIRTSEMTQKLIKDNIGEPKFKPNNVVGKYVILYYILRDFVKLLSEYESQIEDISRLT